MIPTWSIIVCSFLLLTGLVGSIVPFLPGVPLTWLGLLVYALATDFEKISVIAIIVLFVLMAITLTLDFVAPMLGARKYRASIFGVIGAFLGFVVGIIFLGIWGIIIGPIIGAFIGELVVKGKPKPAFMSGVGAFIGLIAGTLFKVVLVFVMIGVFIVSMVF